jgi:elongation factor Tu
MDTHLNLPPRDTQSQFLMPIDNFISVPGRGTVVVGTIKRGTVKKGKIKKKMIFFLKNS